MSAVINNAIMQKVRWKIKCKSKIALSCAANNIFWISGYYLIIIYRPTIIDQGITIQYVSFLFLSEEKFPTGL